MIEIAMVKTVVDISSSLINIASRFSNKEQRDLISDWMLDVATLVKDVADTLERNDFPHGACATMKVYVEKFPSLVSKFMDIEDMEKIHLLLKDAQELEMLHAQLKNLTEDERRASISRLKIASGTLAGHANLMRLGY